MHTHAQTHTQSHTQYKIMKQELQTSVQVAHIITDKVSLETIC